MNWQLILLVLAADLTLRVLVRGRPIVTAEDRTSNDTGLFVIPGVLGDPRNQVSPVKDVLTKHGRLLYCRWGRVFYSPSRNKRVFASEILRLSDYLDIKRKVLFGVSLGGTVALDVAVEMHKLAPDAEKPLLVVLDGVGSGPKNLLSGGNILAPAARWLRFLPFGLITILVFGLIVTVPMSLFINQGPKDSEIEDGLDKEQVKRKAKSDMSWYFTGAFLRQMAHMAQSRLTTNRLLAVSSIVYVQYTQNNVTLHQPAECDAWREAAEAAGVPFTHYTVEAPHVALAQMPTVSSKALEQALGGLLSD